MLTADSEGKTGFAEAAT